MLKRLVKTLEEVDEKYRDLYEADGEDGFILKTDDKEFKEKLDEFRTNNRALFKDKKGLEDTLAKFKDVDPEKYKEAMKALDVLNQYEESQLIKDGKLEEVLSRRTTAMQSEFMTQIDALKAANQDALNQKQTYQEQLGALRVEALANKALGKVGRVRSSAMTDALNRANSVWRLDDAGNITAQINGKAAYGKDGEPLTIDEWSRNLLKDAPHLFEKGSGGGGEGSSGAGESSGDPKIIDRGDPKAFSSNLEAIAAGKVLAK